MQFIIKIQHKTISILIKRLINNFPPLTLFFLILQWKNMNYSTAWWTCAELQRIWRLASDRKWGISHQNTLLKRLVRFIFHYYSRVLPVTGLSVVCLPGYDQKRSALLPFVPAVIDGSACLYCILCRRGARCLRYSSNIELCRFPFAFCLLPAENYTAAKKAFIMILLCRYNVRLAVFSLHNDQCPAHKP